MVLCSAETNKKSDNDIFRGAGYAELARIYLGCLAMTSVTDKATLS
jgi:hypothetical protein